MEVENYHELPKFWKVTHFGGNPFSTYFQDYGKKSTVSVFCKSPFIRVSHSTTVCRWMLFHVPAMFVCPFLIRYINDVTSYLYIYIIFGLLLNDHPMLDIDIYRPSSMYHQSIHSKSLASSQKGSLNSNESLVPLKKTNWISSCFPLEPWLIGSKSARKTPFTPPIYLTCHPQKNGWKAAFLLKWPAFYGTS